MKNLFLILFAIFLLIGCENESKENNELSLRNRNDFSGKDYFKGIFFGVNVYGKSLHYYDALNASFNELPINIQNLNLLKIDSIVDILENRNPDFFLYFKNQILSKDHMQIKVAIGKGSQLLYNNLNLIGSNMKESVDAMVSEIEKSGPNNEEQVKVIVDKYEDIFKNNILTNNDPQAIGFAIVAAIYFAAAVHNTFALTSFVAVVGTAAIYLGVKFWGPGLKSYKLGFNQDPLILEILVDEIASTP